MLTTKEMRKIDVIKKNLMQQTMAERNILQFASNPFIVNMFCSYSTKVCVVV
jgi:hypothetical protein